MLDLFPQHFPRYHLPCVGRQYLCPSSAAGRPEGQLWEEGAEWEGLEWVGEGRYLVPVSVWVPPALAVPKKHRRE